MVKEPWWIEIPGRLEFELEALREVCSEINVFKQDVKSGQLGIRAVLKLGEELYRLRVEFPACYPYTRPVVYAEENSFNWHQNPYGKNLCLLGRTAENWIPTQTLAWHLKEQMPKLIASATTNNLEAAADLEELQAEPFTTFLKYQMSSSMLLLAENLRSDRSRGTFLAAYMLHDGVFRGAVLDLRDNTNSVLLSVPEGMATAMQLTKQIPGKWYRLTERPRTENATDFLNQIAATHPQARSRDWTTHRGIRFEIIGVQVPEETEWRKSGESILFLIVQQHKGSNGRKTETAEFIRTFRADPNTVSARVPEMTGLQNKRILIAGVGSIGAPCVLEFARNSIGALNLADGDFLEAANSVRWPLGVAYAGLPKVIALRNYIAENHPFTQVVTFIGEIGSEAYTLQIEDQLYKDVDLIFDATAERGISYLLSERAKSLGIPYVCISSTQGNWGGMVVAFSPGKTQGCWWCLCKHLEEGTLPIMACGPNSSVQVGGCAAPTFTGSFVDSSEISLMGIRLAISLLSSRYPNYDWDYAGLSLRESDGAVIAPRWQTATLPQHPNCPNHA